MDRTIAIGDLHGDLPALERVMGLLPALDAEDTLVFVGDYVDRGPDSKGTIAYIRELLPKRTPAQIVTLMGNHEDGWLRVLKGGWPEFVWPQGNGCMATVRSYLGTRPTEDGRPQKEEFEALFDGRFLPADVVEWMRDLLPYYEDAHAIYVHAGLPFRDGDFVHPSRVEDPKPLLWERSEKFFREYRGKRVVCGHTQTSTLPQELSRYTPEDPTDLFAHRSVMAIDTGAGKDGFLTAVELPSCRVYESRR